MRKRHLTELPKKCTLINLQIIRITILSILLPSWE
jgi:hypothetical protein